MVATLNSPDFAFLDGAGTALEISERCEAAIRSGGLAAGELLPPIRGLAAALQVNATTVGNAYRQLQTWGLAYGDGRRGTRVIGPANVALGQGPVDEHALDLSSGRADPALLPDLGPALAVAASRTANYGSDPVAGSLRSVAGGLIATDGIPVDHLTVVSGALDGIERVLAASAKSGDRIALEDPCFYRTLNLVRALGMEPEPVSLDDQGMTPAGLSSALNRGARVVIVTPRAQNPTGAALTEDRGEQLRAILRDRPDVLVIEDDHAALIADAPPITLVSSFTRRWAVVRSFAKAFGADLRLAVLVGDETTISRVETRQRLGIGWVSHILQEAAAEMLADPQVAVTLSRARTTYTERREALLQALNERGIRAYGESGMNAWVPVIREAETVMMLRDNGFAVLAGEAFRISAPPGIRVTTAALPSDLAPELAQAMAKVIHRRAASRVLT